MPGDKGFKIDTGMEEVLKNQELAKMTRALSEYDGVTDLSQMTWDQIEDRYREIKSEKGLFNEPFTRWHSKGKPENK